MNCYCSGILGFQQLVYSIKAIIIISLGVGSGAY